MYGPWNFIPYLPLRLLRHVCSYERGFCPTYANFDIVLHAQMPDKNAVHIRVEDKNGTHLKTNTTLIEL